MQALISQNKISQISAHSHKYLPNHGHGVIISAYTRRATNNIRRNLPADLQANAITIHKALEYEPVFEEIFDSETGKTRNTMRFEAQRNIQNKQPSCFRIQVLEEASMIATSLYEEVEAASTFDTQFVFLGDIQQLPPVFGSAILGYKMLELPVIELTEVYRQALDSPIIKLAHRILSGSPIPLAEFGEWNIPGQLKIHPWKKQIRAEAACETLAKFFIHNLEHGTYNPETDAILIPFNKGCGTDELNKHIANKIAKMTQKTVWEIIHGWKKSYYSVGDKVLYDREDAIILNIYPNPTYTGKTPYPESPTLNYHGHDDAESSSSSINLDPSNLDDVDDLLSQVSVGGGEGDDRVNSASHCIVLKLLDSEREVTIKDTGAFNSLILGYALTVHKSQGSEWDKVFLCLHNSHATMIQRELLYTAVTRAKKELFVICEEDTFIKGIERQRIKGDTLEEKAQWFKGKQERGELQS